MSRIAATLFLTLSLLSGQGDFIGFEIGSIPLTEHIFSAQANVLDGQERGDVGGRPRHGCCQVACTQTLCTPDDYALAHDAQPAPRLSPSNDNDPHTAIIRRDPPVPRILIS